MKSLHGMHQPSKMAQGFKVLEKNLLGRVWKFWFWSELSSVGVRMFWENKKLPNHSIKNNYSNLL